MKIPKPIIPVHTCEQGGHQSISHTSQQNRVPREPINRLCNPLNGHLRSEQVSERRSERQRGAGSGEAGEPGAPAGRSKETGPSNRPYHGQFGVLKHPHEESEGPLKAFAFPSGAARVHSPFPSQSAGGATMNPKPDPGEAPAPRPRGRRRQAVIACETSVGF